MTATQNPDRRSARHVRFLAPLAALICAFLGTTEAQSAAAASTGPTMTNASIADESLRNATATSTNWAGYAVTVPPAIASPPPATTVPTTPTVFTSVSGRWVQPTVTCTKLKATYSAFWVGLGGFSPTSQALEQIGTAANCTVAGKAKYSMWYELVPAASVPIKFKVFPGNAIAASVTVNGTKVTLQIRNLSRRTNFTKTLNMAAPDLSSAEWIAEAPTGCNASGCEQLPLANFRNLTFTNASATTSDGHVGTITDAAWSPTMIDLEDFTSGPAAAATTVSGAVPSALSTNGASFGVSWQRAIAVPAQSSTSSSSSR
jgi:Peptidase A4 family